MEKTNVVPYNTHMPEKEQFLPENYHSKYLAERLLGKLCEAYGERGNLLAGIHCYLRYVDNQIDENGWARPKNEKLVFMEREFLINNQTFKGSPTKEEERYNSLPWKSIDPLEGKVRSHINLVLHTIKEDLDHQPYYPRTTREIRHYNIRMLYSVLNIVGLVLNGKDIKPTKKFVDFLDSWNKSGSLKDMKEDFKNGLMQLPFSKNEVETILKKQSEDERFNLSLDIYDKNRFKKEKANAIIGIIKNTGSFFDLDMPLWQKLTGYLYTTIRVPLKIASRVNYPPSKEEIIKVSDLKA